MTEPVLAPEPRFPFLLLDVAADDADVFSAALFECGADGVEERDATTLIKGRTGDKVTLVGSFETMEEAEMARESFKSSMEEDPALAAMNPVLEVIVGDAWRDAWKVHFRPFAIGPGIVIRPPWETYEAKAGEIVLELEPGRAFGTGLHETTSLVAGLLCNSKERFAGQEILDVGTGSGILALIALAHGAGKARCTDNDPDVVDVVLENAGRNGLGDRVVVDTTDIKDVAGTYPVVVANIEARILIPMAADLTARVAKDGLLILSGILVPQKADVIAAYAPFGMTVVDAPEKGEWISIAFTKA
jgi:ribosomal protein L11 methyltransferase